MNKKFSKIMLTSASALALFAAYPSVAQNANEALGLDLETITAEAATAAGRNFIDRVVDLPNVSEIAKMTPEGIQDQSREMRSIRRAYDRLSAADKDATVERWENFLYRKERAIGNVFVDIVMDLHNIDEILEFNTEDFAAEQQRARRARNQYNDLSDVAKANPQVARWLDFLEYKEQPLGITFVDLVQLVPNVETLNNLTDQDLAAAVKAYETAKASYDKLPDAAKRDALVVRWAGFLEVKADAIRDEIENGEETPAELTVDSVSAINETTLLVIMSDGSSHEVVLENNQKLVPNVKTSVSFAVDGDYYTADVIYTEKSVELEQEILEAQEALNQARDNFSDALNDLEQANTDYSYAVRYYDADSEEVLAAEEALANAELKATQTWTRLGRATDTLYSLLQGTDYAVAYEKAVAAVEKAERSRNQIDVTAAQNAVNTAAAQIENTGDSYDPLLSLQERINAVQAEINATTHVGNLESMLEDETVTQEDIDWVKGEVEALVDGPAKEALLARVNAVQVAVDEAEATGNVEWAEGLLEAGTLTQGQFDWVEGKVEDLEDGAVKNALLARLEAVQAGIDAHEAVLLAERAANAENLANAQTLVAALEDGDFKDALLDRVEVVENWLADRAEEKAQADFIAEVQELPLLTEIAKMNATDLAEATEEVAAVRASYEALSADNKKNATIITWENALTEKEEALTEREVTLAYYFVRLAEEAPLVTEGNKVDAQKLVDEAQAFVNNLDDGAAKTELNGRLAVVRTKIAVA